MHDPLSTRPSTEELDELVRLYNQGRLQEALTRGRSLAEQYPQAANIPNILGAIYIGLGRKSEAVECLQAAVRLKPDFVQAHNNLGYLLNSLGDYQGAMKAFNRCLTLRPNSPEVHYNLGNTLKRLGRYNEAIDCYRRALQLKPDYLEACNHLGITFNELAQSEKAVEQYKKALELKPDNANVHYNLGIALDNLGRNEEAAASFHKAFSLDRSHTAARCSWLNQLAQICDWDQLLEELRFGLTALEFGNTPKAVTSPFVLLSLIDDPELHRRAAEAYAAVYYMDDSGPGPFAAGRNAKRIRIGYYSADFHNHATMHLMARLFECHDRSRFEIHAFSFGPENQDDMQQNLRNTVEFFHDVRHMGHADIVALSRRLGIDIAVDLKGYTKHKRPNIFACRAAPIQVSYLGYPGTMGAPYIDYIIADPVVIPEESRQFYSEKVAYLPDCYQVNDNSRNIAESLLSRSDHGLPANAFVFCCFNNNYKIMPEEFGIWMRLLAQVDGSVLWLLRDNPAAERNLRHAAETRGIDPARLVFADRIPPADHLARQRLADLFLDTFVYNAHTTTSDALWAGLPVLTRLGRSFASRVAGSLLYAVGLPELVTATAADYEATALRLATCPDELQALRDRLKGAQMQAALFDTARFTRYLESAYAHMVRRLGEGLGPEHFSVER